MDERSFDRQGDHGHGDHHGHGHEGRGHDGHRGPPETDWLDLEMSRVIQSRAEALTRSAAEEILREAIMARLRERLGPRLEAIGRLVADQFVDDIEANLDIEARIKARREARRGLDERIAEVLGKKDVEP